MKRLLQLLSSMIQDDFRALWQKRDAETLLRTFFYLSFFLFLFYLVYHGLDQSPAPPEAPAPSAEII